MKAQRKSRSKQLTDAQRRLLRKLALAKLREQPLSISAENLLERRTSWILAREGYVRIEIWLGKKEDQPQPYRINHRNWSQAKRLNYALLWEVTLA